MNEEQFGHYDINELGWWIHLMVKRSKCRRDPGDALNDLDQALKYNGLILEAIGYEQEAIQHWIDDGANSDG